MVTILLQKILDLLRGFVGDFTTWAADVFEKLGFIQEQTENLDDILIDTTNISNNTNSIASSNEYIRQNTTQINNKLTTIQTNVTTIANNSGSIATSAGTAAAFAEDCATNGLNILDKVTTIASDTTQMRADNVVVKSDLDKIYEALKYTLLSVIITETNESNSPLNFETDVAANLEDLKFSIRPIETGSGTKSPSNPYTISGHSTFTYSFNTLTDSILLSLMVGSNVYGAELDILTGKLKVTCKLVKFSDLSWTSSTWGNYTAYSATVNDSLYNGTATLSGLACEMYSEVTPGVMYSHNNESICLNGHMIRLRNTTYSTFAEWQTATANCQIVYPLEFPVEYNGSPQTLAALQGLNSITSTGNGKIKVTYKESAKFYLDKQEA